MPPIVASAPGSTGNIETGVSQGLRKLQSRDARFDGGIEIFRADAKDAVHLTQVDGDTAPDCVHVSFERGSRAERDEGQLEALADIHDLDDFLRVHGEADHIGRGWLVVGLPVTVMFEDGRGVGRA